LFVTHYSLKTVSLFAFLFLLISACAEAGGGNVIKNEGSVKTVGNINSGGPSNARDSSGLLRVKSMVSGSGNTGGSGITRVTGNTLTIKSIYAARFLTQATFGPTADEIRSFVQLDDVNKWFEQQVGATYRAHLPYVKERQAAIDQFLKLEKEAESFAYISRHHRWWDSAINSKAQLRHRIAFALSQIFVVSEKNPNLKDAQYALTDYYDMLVRNAFGNFRTILEDVSLHPAMGIFLSALKNEKADRIKNIRPDENYAREIMQLFSIGVHLLNQDGTPQLNSQGNTIPTYNEDLVKEFAKVFTGWNLAHTAWQGHMTHGSTTQSMVPWNNYHDMTEKQLLNEQKLPEDQKAEQDLDAALDNIFNHQNVAPFISKQLIQRFVTSNPKPAYVKRVANVFDDNGNGVRGDMLAVIKAILLDDEARNGAGYDPGFGKLKEPLLVISHVWRALSAIKFDRGEYGDFPGVLVYRIPQAELNEFTGTFGQGILSAPSVFNFYRTDYSPPGVLREQSITAPEFQILNENTLANLLNTLNWQVQNSHTSETQWGTTFDLQPLFDIGDDTKRLLDVLNLVFLSGQMQDDLRQIIHKHLNSPVFPPGSAGVKVRVKDAITLVISSPDFMVQR